MEHFIYLYRKKKIRTYYTFIYTPFLLRNRKSKEQAGRQAGKQEAGRQAGRLAGRQAGWQAGRQAGTQAGRLAGRQARSFLAFLLKMMIGPHNNQRHVGKDKGQAEQDI